MVSESAFAKEIDSKVMWPDGKYETAKVKYIKRRFYVYDSPTTVLWKTWVVFYILFQKVSIIYFHRLRTLLQKGV